MILNMRAGQIIAVLVLTLFVFGVVMVASAGLRPLPRTEAAIEVNPDGGSLYLELEQAPMAGTTSAGRPNLTGRTVMDTVLGKEGRMAMIAVFALAIGVLVPVERLANLKGLAAPAPWLLTLMVTLLLMTLMVGREAHGAVRWLEIGGVGFQPSEIAKWGLPAVIAWHCVRHAEGMNRFFTGVLPPLVLGGVICALIAKEDLGTAVLVMSVCMLMLLAAGGRFMHLAAIAPVGLAGFVGFVLMSPERQRRITSFMAPFEHADRDAYQLIQSMGAIAEGGFGGRGLGHSLQKFDYLPFDHTDFIFAIICEELGFFGATLLIMIFIGILLAGLAIVTGKASPAAGDEAVSKIAVPAYSRLLGFGILITFGFQAAINIAVVTGLAPTKGIALPLVSQGGTGWVLTAFSLGLVISMDRHAWNVSRRAGLIEDQDEMEEDIPTGPRSLTLGEA